MDESTTTIFNDNVIGKLNPKTGETLEYRFPDLVDILPELAAEGSMIPVGQSSPDAGWAGQILPGSTGS